VQFGWALFCGASSKREDAASAVSSERFRSSHRRQKRTKAHLLDAGGRHQLDGTQWGPQPRKSTEHGPHREGLRGLCLTKNPHGAGGSRNFREGGASLGRGGGQKSRTEAEDEGSVAVCAEIIAAFRGAVIRI